MPTSPSPARASPSLRTPWSLPPRKLRLKTSLLEMNFLNRSEYFEMALSKDWLEKKERRMELKECSAEALHVAVNFMYGNNVPEDFKEHGKLLHLAELFMMDNLKEVIEERLEKALTKLNYLETVSYTHLRAHET